MDAVVTTRDAVAAGRSRVDVALHAVLEIVPSGVLLEERARLTHIAVTLLTEVEVLSVLLAMTSSHLYDSLQVIIALMKLYFCCH